VLQSVVVRCSISSDCGVDRESGDVVVDLCSDTISESDDIFDANDVFDASFTAASFDCNGASISDDVHDDLSGPFRDDLRSDTVSESDDVSESSDDAPDA